MQEYSRAGRGSGLDGGLCAGPEAWLARCEQHPLICMGHKDLRESGPSLPLSPPEGFEAALPTSDMETCLLFLQFLQEAPQNPKGNYIHRELGPQRKSTLFI